MTRGKPYKCTTGNPQVDYANTPINREPIQHRCPLLLEKGQICHRYQRPGMRQDMEDGAICMGVLKGAEEDQAFLSNVFLLLFLVAAILGKHDNSSLHSPHFCNDTFTLEATLGYS